MLPKTVAGAIFPTLMQAISGKFRESRCELIEQSFRLVLVTLLLVIALVGCCAKDVVIFRCSLLPAQHATVSR